MLIVLVFMLGWGLSDAYRDRYSFDNEITFKQIPVRHATQPSWNEDKEDATDKALSFLTGRAVLDMFQKNSEKSSPFDRVNEDQILIYHDKIVLKVSDATWTSYTDTNSMDPVLDDGANGLEIVPKSEEDIYVGDIVSYEIDGVEGLIVHRVYEISEDELGWYVKMKGDNSPDEDPTKVRFDQIKYVLIGVIY